MKDTTKGQALRVVSVVALAVVVLAPAAASWHGLVETGKDVFHLTDGWEYVVPLALDGAALYSGTLAIRAVLSGDSAIGARLLTALYALAAAGFNAYHAQSAPGGNTASALFFAGASLSAVVLWDVTLRALRRDQLREAGLIEAPLPRWRLLRWIVAPGETARAWRLAVVEQINDPAEALRLARSRREGKDPLPAVAERIADAPALPEGPERTDENQADEQDTTAPLFTLPSRTSKKAALVAAFDYLGRKDVPAALELLDQQGIAVDRSYAYTVAWKPSLRAVGSESQ